MGSNNQFNDFTLPQNAYTAFDATSLRNLIIQRLNQQGVFTDQNYTGSNISSIIDIVAYSYHVLLFYLNQTGSEGLYSSSSLYENINKIVKGLGYNPIGYQTSTLSFNCHQDGSLSIGTYTIPRYSYFTLNGVNYAFGADATFSIDSVDPTIEITDLSDNFLLYEGTFSEYPIYTANGEPFEQFTLALTDNTGTNIKIDHFNVNVYVQDNTSSTPAFAQYTSTQSLFLEASNSLKYEIRLNESGRYEIKFGNNIHGKQLNVGDFVAVYYLKTDGATGQVSENILNNSSLLLYQSSQFTVISADVISTDLNIINTSETPHLIFSNSSPSTPFTDIESVSSIKVNALNTFKTQYRLITTDDFQSYITGNFSNILGSVRCVNNTDFVNNHLKYYFDLGVEKPNQESRVLFNQVNFSSSCNTNNVYVYGVPLIGNSISLTNQASYLSNSQKQNIVAHLEPFKIVTSDIVFADPVYTYFDFTTKTVSPSGTQLQLTISSLQSQNAQSIIQQVAQIFTQYFSTTNDNLGALVSLTELSNQILAINGVNAINTVGNTDTQSEIIPGICLLAYNPIYSNDSQVIQQNIQLPFYKFPIFNNASTLTQRISAIFD